MAVTEKVNKLLVNVVKMFSNFLVRIDRLLGSLEAWPALAGLGVIAVAMASSRPVLPEVGLSILIGLLVFWGITESFKMQILTVLEGQLYLVGAIAILVFRDRFSYPVMLGTLSFVVLFNMANVIMDVTGLVRLVSAIAGALLRRPVQKQVLKFQEPETEGPDDDRDMPEDELEDEPES